MAAHRGDIRVFGIGVVPIDTVKRPGKRKENVTSTDSTNVLKSTSDNSNPR